jgi:hypothetical protein
MGADVLRREQLVELAARHAIPAMYFPARVRGSRRPIPCAWEQGISRRVSGKTFQRNKRFKYQNRVFGCSIAAEYLAIASATSNIHTLSLSDFIPIRGCDKKRKWRRVQAMAQFAKTATEALAE